MHIYMLEKLGSARTKVETNSKPDGDSMNKNQSVQPKWASNPNLSGEGLELKSKQGPVGAIQ